MGISPGWYISGILVAALYFTVSWGLEQFEDKVELDLVNRVNEATAEFKEEKEAALQALRDEYDGKITANETAYKERENEYIRELMAAREAALQEPIEFGDNFIRDFIYVDCVLAAGTSGDSPEGKRACRSEAEGADPTSAGLYAATLKPDFLRAWGDACEDWERVGTGEGDLAYSRDDWTLEYGNFDADLCRDGIVAFTPEATVFLSRFAYIAADYVSDLRTHIGEQEETIDILVKKMEEPE